MWCIPKVTEEYKERTLDVLEVYEREYDKKKPVICFDEKSTQLLGRKREGKPLKKGSGKKIDYEYVRYGTVNLFVAVEPKGKKRHITVTKRRTREDFAREIETLVSVKYKAAEKVILVMDNLNTHNEKSIRDVLGEDKAEKILKKIEWHYTPKHASWLNMAEIEIGVITKQLLGREITSFSEMQRHAGIWTRDRNNKRVGINWQFTRNKATEKFKIHTHITHEN